MDCNAKEFQSSLAKALQRYLGEFGYIDASPRIIKTTDFGTFILRVARGQERKAILALAFIKELNGTDTGIYTLKTSGTVLTLSDYVVKTSPMAENARKMDKD